MLPICRLLGRRLCGAGWVNKEYGNAIELDTVGRQFEPNRWRPCEVIWDAVPEQSWLLKLRRKVAENPPFSSGRQVQVKVHRPGAAGSCSRSCHDLERLSLPSGTTASREGKSCSESGPDRRILARPSRNGHSGPVIRSGVCLNPCQIICGKAECTCRGLPRGPRPGQLE